MTSAGDDEAGHPAVSFPKRCRGTARGKLKRRFGLGPCTKDLFLGGGGVALALIQATMAIWACLKHTNPQHQRFCFGSIDPKLTPFEGDSWLGPFSRASYGKVRQNVRPLRCTLADFGCVGAPLRCRGTNLYHQNQLFVGFGCVKSLSLLRGAHLSIGSEPPANFDWYK